MRRLGLALLLCAVAPLPSCGGGSAATPAAPTGVEAGTVTEVEGAVTATRAGATRPLAVGARVHDDDVIATGTGRVAIKLDRNQVVWRLGPELSQQVARSAAWSAPAAAGQVAATDEHSAAAGRHAEREAADTAASAAPAAPAAAPLPDDGEGAKGAVPRSRGGLPSGAGREVAAAEPMPPPPPKVEPPADPTTGATDDLRADDPRADDPPADVAPGRMTALAAPDRGAGGASGGGTDDANARSARAPDPDAVRVAPTDPIVRPAKPAPPRLTLGKIITRGTLSNGAVRAQAEAAIADLSACTDGLPTEASFVWSFRVSADGVVGGSAIAGVAPTVVACVAAVAAGWRFPKAKRASTAKVAISLD